MTTYDSYHIVWVNNTYEVFNALLAYPTSSTSTNVKLSNGSLTWTYSIPDGTEFTFTTVTLSGDTLTVKWTSTDGGSGTKTLTRVG